MGYKESEIRKTHINENTDMNKKEIIELYNSLVDEYEQLTFKYIHIFDYDSKLCRRLTELFNENEKLKKEINYNNT